ncbi:MAG: hypothetical protein ABSB50_00195 [Terracidiphilus sp.]|jgi:hypothetical protein
MSFIDLLRKGFGYVLLSMGVSRPAPKPKPEAKPAPKPGSGAPGGSGDHGN